VKLFRRRAAPSREDIRRAVPVRAPRLTQEGTVLSVPLEQRAGPWGWLARKTGAPNTAEIELDEIGAFVWGLIDDKRTIAGIADSLSKHYKLTKPEAEASLLEFIDRLRRRGCVYLKRK
jgi:hypothetical protein